MKRLNEEKLSELAEFITEFALDTGGDTPTFQEIKNKMGMSNSVAYRYLMVLKERGIIDYSGKGTLSVPGLERAVMKKIPLFGAIPCGEPEDYREESLGYLSLPSDWLDGDGYLLMASGDSMVDVGIDSGDLVLIKKQSHAPNGAIAAILTEDGTTLKRFHKDLSGEAWLSAENSSYPESKRILHPKLIIVQGVAVKIIKDVKCNE